MDLIRFLPTTMLRPFIEYYWVFESDKPVMQQTLLPSGRMEIAINISSGTLATGIGNQVVPMPDVELLGQLTRPALISVSGKIKLLIVRFRPHAASFFLPQPLFEFTNKSLDISALLPGIHQLHHSINEQPDLHRMVRVLDGYFADKIGRVKIGMDKFSLLKNICMEETEAANLAQIAEKYGYSLRYLQKLFLSLIGISPKTYFTIKRFNRCLNLISASDQSFTSVAYELGYADQSHFIREFRKYSGGTPRHFQAAHNR